jgi:hypothetical protein
MLSVDIDYDLECMDLVDVGTVSICRVQTSHSLGVGSVSDISDIYSAPIFRVNTRLMYCDCLHGGSMYFRNVGSTAHTKTQSKNKHELELFPEMRSM